MPESDIKSLSFQSGAMSIIQMGEELIGHPTTAINELVKNSYDADSTSCHVYIHNDSIGSFMVIYDNGSGMNASVLFGDWLQPSKSNKREIGKKSSVYGRSLLGSKGIGRLASMALGDNLTVISKTDQDKKYNWLSLNRNKFRTDNLLSTVKFPGGEIQDFLEVFQKSELLKKREVKSNDILGAFLRQNNSSFKKGTLIIIEDLDPALINIIEEDFNKTNTQIEGFDITDTIIFRSLSVLITPLELNFQIQKELVEKRIIEKSNSISNEDSKFELSLGSNLYFKEKRAYVKVNPIQILGKYDYRMIGKVTEKGDIKAFYSCLRLPKYSFTDDFTANANEVFEKEYSKIKSEKDIETADATLFNDEVGEFYFDIRIFDRGEEDSKAKLYSLIRADNNTQKNRILDTLLGLRVSQNGFSVKPYGEEVKDWLNLGQIRVQNPGQSVSTNQILGYVFFFSPENDALKEKTNREGFYENKAFKDIKYSLQVVIKNIGRLRYNYRLEHGLGRIPKNRLVRPDTNTFLSFIKENTDKDKLFKKSEAFVKEITTALDNMEDTLTFSQRLASLGTGLELVYHELSQPIAKLGGSRAILSRRANKISDEVLKNSFIQEISEIGIYVSELDDLKKSLKPAIGRSREETFLPFDTFKKVCSLFRKDFTEEDIEILHSEAAEKFEVIDYEYALWITFLNIINNAVYWLKTTGQKKRLSFAIENENEIVISNNGPQIPEDSIDFIFEYGYTLKKEKSATGLGLAFCKNILNLNDWDIIATNREIGPVFIIYKRKT